MFETDESATEELVFNIEQPSDDVASEEEVSTEAESQPQVEAESQQTQELEVKEPVDISDGDENTEKQKAADTAYKLRAEKRRKQEAEKLAELKANEEASKVKADKDKRDAEMYEYYRRQQLGPKPDINDDKYLNDDGSINSEQFATDIIDYNSKIPESTESQGYQAKTQEQMQLEAQLHVVKNDTDDVKSVLPNYNKVMESSDRFLETLGDVKASEMNDFIAGIVHSHEGMGLNYAKVKASLSVKGAQNELLEARNTGSLNTPYAQAKFFKELQSKYFDNPVKKKKSNNTTPPPNVNTNGGAAFDNDGLEKYGNYS